MGDSAMMQATCCHASDPAILATRWIAVDRFTRFIWGLKNLLMVRLEIKQC